MNYVGFQCPVLSLFVVFCASTLIHISHHQSDIVVDILDMNLSENKWHQNIKLNTTWCPKLLIMLFIQYFNYNVVTFCSHFLMQSEWNRCLQGSVFTTSSCSKCFRQMAQFLSSENSEFGFLYIYRIYICIYGIRKISK